VRLIYLFVGLNLVKLYPHGFHDVRTIIWYSTSFTGKSNNLLFPHELGTKCWAIPLALGMRSYIGPLYRQGDSFPHTW
jgi:hypothetical protein